MSTICELCGREPKKGTTAHHLIPRTCHKNRWFQKNFTREEMAVTVMLCRDCHKAIHKFVPKEKDLGRYWNTLDSIRAMPEMAKFLNWIRKQK